MQLPDPPAQPQEQAARRRLSFLILAAPAAFWICALARFYRRFVYDEPTGRVWALSDDMYISACFGRSLFSGAGFVWYEGAPRVEGISNPLWTVFVGALHALPGFNEDRLGLFVIVCNAALLVAVVALFVCTALRALRGSAPATAVSCAAALLLPWPIALTYWSAEGFEVAWLAALSFGGIQLALLPRTRARALALGLLLAAGVATRMDFVVLASGICLIAISHARGPRTTLAWTALLSILLIGALLVARRVYFGDWLPNTYYLKTTGWPVAARLRRGVHQNSVLLGVAALAFAPLLLPRVRKNLGAVLPCIVAGWTAFAAAVAYSTYVGGDAWSLFAGYDRHTAAAGVLLAWSNCLLICAAARSGRTRALCGVWSVLLLAAPIFAQDGVGQIQRGLFASYRLRANERDWIEYGKRFREVSLPGARIAVCPAGAIIYFSHRGGVDLLGKVDRFVAHLDVSERRTGASACWRYAPGHNKGDDRAVFALERPEFARGKLPRSERGHYFPIKYKTSTFLVRKDTTLLRPELRPSAH